MKSNFTAQKMFNEEVLAAIQAYLGSDYRVSVNKVIKNNDTVLFGLNIVKQKSVWAPTIYLDEYYAQYQSGMRIPEIVKEIIAAYESKEESKLNIGADDLMDFKKIKNKVVFKLINLERNKKFLADVPYLRLFDLAIVFSVIVSMDRDEIASTTIRNSLLNLWGADIDTLLELARRNTPKLLPASIRDMKQVKMDILDNDISDEAKEQLAQMDTSGAGQEMYVASNCSGINGAAVMLYDGLIRNFANDIEADLFIIPSSIHELILLPVKGHMRPDDIREMIDEVNITKVQPNEVLGDNVYLYSRKADRIGMIG